MNWNQGPSHLREYPLELTAGYDLLELDVDAHTRSTFQDKDRLASALREIQEVQMLPADQLALTPGDTLTTNRWEAWYPSAVTRIINPENRAAGSEAVLGPWYSWRESLLVWPEWWSKETKQPVDLNSPRDSAFHPFLDAIVKQLKGGQDPTQGYLVHVQPLPAIQPGDFKAFVKSTDPNSDPYGWGVLQRFGLSITISLRDVQSGELILGEELLSSVNKAIQDSMDELTLDDKTKVQAQRLRDHLFVELLFQPGRSIHLEVADTNPSALLGILQISLRPIAKQQLQYGQLELSGPAGSEVAIAFKDATWPCSVINQSDLDRGQMEIVERPSSIQSTDSTVPIAATPDSKSPSLTLKLPMHGTTKLYVRAKILPNISVTSKSSAQGQSLELKPASGFEALGAADPVSTYFSRSIDSLADLFFEDENAVREWDRFCWYAQSLNSTDPAVPESAKISLPKAPSGKSAISPEQAKELKSKLAKEILPEFLAWSQRFFDASTALTSETGPHGPWVASAYARVESPAHAAPDKAGRLTYHHLLQDRWAHNYRYYVRPIDRYSYLWQGLLESPVLFPSGTPESTMARRIAQEMKSVGPDPLVGGLDVVLDRTYPIDMPLVLSSKRLDLTGLPGQPELPGQTWEVIVAQHREQALMERNQTVARRLGYRNISFALQRRFIYDDWVQVLAEMFKTSSNEPHKIKLQIPSDHYPDIPLRYPDTPDRLAIEIDGTAGATLLPAESKSLDLPNRMERFQQGAIVLQWDGLPFFYEHQLLLIAQTSTTLSPINRVVQRDFEYRSPEPVAKMRGEPNASALDRGSDRNELHMLLSLRPFWDSLPSRAQDHWKAEEPTPNDLGRKPASLPDREVVYQLVAIYSGNIEVQAEFLFDEEKEDFVVRQLGRSYQATIADFIPAIGANDLYALNILLEEQTEFPIHLAEAFGRAGLIQSQPETTPEDAADEKSLRFQGVFTRQDRNKLLIHLTPELCRLADNPGTDQELVEAFLEKWFATRMIGATPDLTAIALDEKVSYVPVVEWVGRIDDAQKSAFAAWIDEADAVTRVTLEKILGKLKLQDATDSIGAIAEISLIKSEPRMPPKATLAHDLPKLSWIGSLTAKDADELRTVFFKTAVERLIAEAAKQTIEVPYDSRLAGISQAEFDTALGSDVGRLKLPELPANNETPVPNVRWRGIYELESALEKLTELKPELADLIDNIRKQAESATISIEYRSSSDIPTVLKPSFEFQKSLMRISSPLTDDEVARLKSLFSGSDLNVIDHLLADLRDRMAIDRVYESWLYEEPVSSVNAFASPSNAKVKPMGGYLLEWNGSFDEKDKIELEQLQGDEWFQPAIKRLVGSLKETADVVRQRVRVVVPAEALYEIPAELPSKLLIFTATLSHHGHMSEAEASAIRATCRNESDQDAVTRLYEKSNVGRRGVDLFVMSRRGSAPPSKMIPVTV